MLQRFSFGLKYPDKPEVGVGALVVKDGKIVLVRRVNPPGKDLWSVPGGHLRLGESVYEAAVRELNEETGLHGEAVGIANIDEYVEVDEVGRIKYHYVLIDVLVEVKESLIEARASSDAKEVGIFTLQEALSLKLTKSTRSLIEKLLSRGIKILKSNHIIVKRR